MKYIALLAITATIGTQGRRKPAWQSIYKGRKLEGVQPGEVHNSEGKEVKEETSGSHQACTF